MALLQKVAKLIPKKASREERTFFTELAKAIDGQVRNVSSNQVSFVGVYKTLQELGNPIDKNGVVSAELPGTPTGFQASAAFTSVILSWDAPSYYGHDFAEIYRHTVDDIDAAKANGVWLRSYDVITGDSVDTGSTYYYWIRFVNKAGQTGPFNSPNGTVAQTSVPYEQMLSSIEGMIDVVHLAQSLADPIAKIPTIESGLNSAQSSISSLQQTTSLFSQEIADARNLAEHNANDLVDSVIQLSQAYSSEADARRDSVGQVQRYVNAIITTDPVTGVITLDAVEAFKSEYDSKLSVVNQRLDSAEGKFAIKVWQSDIDAAGNQILSAVDDEILVRSGVCSISDYTDAGNCVLNGGTWTLSSLAQEKKTLIAYADTAESNAKAYTDSQVTVVADALQAEVSRTDGIATQLGNAESNITGLQQSVTAIEGENYTLQINNATSRISQNESDISGLQDGLATVQQSTYTKTESDQIVAGVTESIASSNKSSIESEHALAEAVMQNALAASDEVDVRRETNASITRKAEALTEEDLALAQSIELLQASVGENGAAILNEQTARADADGSLSQKIDTVQASLGDQIASVEQQATAIASDVNGLNVRYSVKLDVNGYVTGFVQNNNGSTGSFLIRADQFGIIDPLSDINQSDLSSAQLAASIPFFVSGGSTYIKNAYIKDLTADNLAAGAVTADKISVTSLSAVSSNMGTVIAYSANIANGAITEAKIGSAAVTNAKIANAAVTNAKIANLSVDSAKIADAAISSAKIGNLQVSTLKIADNAVTIPLSASGSSSASTAWFYFPNTTRVAIIAEGTWNQGGVSNKYLQIAVDGVVRRSEQCYSYTLNAAIIYLITVTPGSHYFSAIGAGSLLPIRTNVLVIGTQK